MSLNDFSNITVSKDGPALSQVGFGTLLLACYHTHWTERTRVYFALTDVANDGFATTEPGYKMAQVAFSQNPRPVSIKIGRLANPPAMSVRIVPVLANSTVYSFALEAEGHTPVETISFTSDSTATLAEVLAGLKAALDAKAMAGVVGTVDGGNTHLDVTLTAGKMFWISQWDRSKLQIEDLTPDPGIAADLNAIRLADSDFYGLAVSENGKAIAKAAADWAETQTLVYATETADFRAPVSGDSTDLQSQLAAESLARSIVTARNAQNTYFCVGQLAERFPFDPGSPPAAGGTFHAKTIAGVAVDTWTPTEVTNLKAKGYTVYTTTAGLNLTQGGKSPSGEFLDFTRFVDWFTIRLQEKLVLVQASNGRVPYTDLGISLEGMAAKTQLSEGLRSGGVAPTLADGVTAPSVTLPLLSATSQQDRAGRVLGGGGIAITFRYAGAIHFVNVGINISK